MKEKASYEQLQAWIREMEKRAGVQPSAIHDLEDVVDHLPGRCSAPKSAIMAPGGFFCSARASKAV